MMWVGNFDHPIVGSGSSGIMDSLVSSVSSTLVFTIAIPTYAPSWLEAEIVVTSPTNSLPKIRVMHHKCLLNLELID